MRIAIIGAGGIGGFYGGQLARAGNDVSLLARGANLTAMRERGIEIRIAQETFVTRVHASQEVKDFEGIECAIVSVKSYSLAEVAPAIRFLAESGAIILPLLNGIEVFDRLVELGVPTGQLLAGFAAISAVRVGPGVFERRSAFQRIVFGEMAGGHSERTGRIAKVFTEAGIEAEVSPNITIDLWGKFAFIASAAAACGLARAPIGALRATPLGRRLFERAVREVIAVGRSRGVALGEENINRVLGFFNTLPEAMKPSLLLDIEAGGPTEIDDLSGAVSRLGSLAGIETPIHDTATIALGGAKPQQAAQ